MSSPRYRRGERGERGVVRDAGESGVSRSAVPIVAIPTWIAHRDYSMFPLNLLDHK